MPTLAAGNRPSWASACAGASSRAKDARDGGFTLVELMIVITIIGVASAAVAFAIPDPRGRLRDEGLRFAGRVRAAHDAAIVGARPVSLWVSPGGYGFDRRSAATWVAMGEKPLRVERWSAGTVAGVHQVGGRDRVVFDETGLADRPLDVGLTRDRVQVHVRIAGDGTVRIDD